MEPGDTRVVEISHEALIREWPTLREWLTQDRQGLILHRQLTQDTQEWAKLEKDPGALYRGARLEAGLKNAAEKAGVPVQINRVGSMLTLFFAERPVTDYASARTSNTRRYATFFHNLLERGVYVAPSQFEAMFISLAHTEQEIAKTVEQAAQSFEAVANER